MMMSIALRISDWMCPTRCPIAYRYRKRIPGMNPSAIRDTPMSVKTRNGRYIV
jgi:hypothetical protein